MLQASSRLRCSLGRKVVKLRTRSTRNETAKCPGNMDDGTEDVSQKFSDKLLLRS